MSSEIKDNAPAGPAGMMAPTERRVPSHTSKRDNAAINEHTIGTIKSIGKASSADLTSRIRKLQWEWDIERTLEATASIIILASLLLLGFSLGRPFLAMLAASAVAALLLLHATQGWCPPMPLFRKIGFRTSYEIMDELVALRMLRGDFDTLIAGPNMSESIKEGRRSDMVDSMVRNMRDSGRLLGRI